MTHFSNVNRHLRRQAERRRRRLAGYRHRIAAALDSSPAIAAVMHAVVEHDGWCAIYQHCPCSCTPNILLIPVDGGDGVYVIDEHGQARLASNEKFSTAPAGRRQNRGESRCTHIPPKGALAHIWRNMFTIFAPERILMLNGAAA